MSEGRYQNNEHDRGDQQRDGRDAGARPELS